MTDDEETKIIEVYADAAWIEWRDFMLSKGFDETAGGWEIPFSVLDLDPFAQGDNQTHGEDD